MNEETVENPRGIRRLVSLASLYLDPNNYRIVDDPDYRSVASELAFNSDVQRRTTRFILGHNQENVRDLIASIKANGWLDIDPILVERRKGRFLVLEGNRRVATLKYLQRRYEEVSIDLEQLDSAIFSKVPVVFHEFAGESQQLVMMGLHHISGKRRWPAVNRAMAIRKLQDHFLGDADAVCNALGITKQEFNLSTRTLALVEAYKDSDYGDQFKSDQFNLYREVIKSRPIREWLCWNERSCIVGNEANLERLFRWMSAEPEQEGDDDDKDIDLQPGFGPVLTTVGHIRELAKIIGDPDAVARLDETRSLQEATLSSSLLVKSEIEQAFATADSGIQRLGKRVGNLAKEELHRVDQLIGKLQGLALAHKRNPIEFNDRLPWEPFNEITQSQFSRLRIKRYRGIGKLELNDLKPVNLIVGVNNAGKTSLLEAIYLLTRQHDLYALLDIIRWRARFDEEPGPLWLVEQIPPAILIEGHFDEVPNNEVSLNVHLETEPDESIWEHSEFLAKLEINSCYAEQTQRADVVLYSTLPRRVDYDGRHWLCRSAFSSPFWISRTDSLSEGNRAAFVTGTKKKVVEFINCHVDRGIQNIELVDKFNRFLVSHTEFDHSPDLSTFGDGMRRIFEICLVIAGVRGGVLLIDEFENSIHRDLLIPFTRLVQDFAYELNVQVFLTTHSKEAIDAFIGNNYRTDDIAAFAISRAEGSIDVHRFGGNKLFKLNKALDLDLRGIQ